MEDYNKLLILALKAVLNARHEILSVYNDHIDVETKDDGSPITMADKASDKIITSTLSESEIPVISEESNLLQYDKRKDSKFLWIVDPLDGTKEFIKRNGEFTINIALVNRSEPVFGITAVPVQDTVYLGCIKRGAYKIAINNDLKIDPESSNFQSILNHSEQLFTDNTNNLLTIATSRSYKNVFTEKLFSLLTGEDIPVKIIRRGSALKFGLIAEGTANIYIRGGHSYEWDTASGHALVAAAGGEVLSLTDGQPLKYNKPDLKNPGFIAISSLKLWERIRKKITF